MSMHATKATALQNRINSRVRLGDDLDEALASAISSVYPLYSEDKQADVFAALRPVLDKYPAGQQRKIGLTTALRSYNYGARFGN